MTNFAINGFGRIGRSILRALFENYSDTNLKCSAINIGVGDIETFVHLLKYDSTHGIFANVSIIDQNTIKVNDSLIKIIKKRNPAQIDWKALDISCVLECTGAFTKRDLAAIHLSSGARKVLVSAPCQDADITAVYGVNHQSINSSHRVISVGSCTTNCLAPIAKILNDNIGIVSGFMTTVHAYTNDQNVLDAFHKDKRRARSASVSMIPSSTGAALALGLVIPELAGKLDGTSLRVPVPNVSFIDLTFVASKNTSVEEINSIVTQNVVNMSGVLEVVSEDLVSIDFNHNPKSCIFDSTQTKVVNNNFCRIAAWYDNEWGFSNRMLDMTLLLKKL